MSNKNIFKLLFSLVVWVFVNKSHGRKRVVPLREALLTAIGRAVADSQRVWGESLGLNTRGPVILRLTRQCFGALKIAKSLCWSSDIDDSLTMGCYATMYIQVLQACSQSTWAPQRMLGLFDASITWNGGNAMVGHSPFI